MFGHDAIAIFFALLLGAVLGLEREISGKAAGLRTNVLICMGAALFTIISRRMGEGESVTRIAAQVVSGIGFLGAGAIIQDRGGIKGLTTAATIWLVASVGVSCGAGYYGLAFIAAIAAVIVLFGLAKVEKRIKKSLKSQSPTAEDHEQPKTTD